MHGTGRDRSRPDLTGPRLLPRGYRVYDKLIVTDRETYFFDILAGTMRTADGAVPIESEQDNARGSSTISSTLCARPHAGWLGPVGAAGDAGAAAVQDEWDRERRSPTPGRPLGCRSRHWRIPNSTRSRPRSRSLPARGCSRRRSRATRMCLFSRRSDFVNGLYTSFIVATASTAIVLVVGTLAAYSLYRFRWAHWVVAGLLGVDARVSRDPGHHDGRPVVSHVQGDRTLRHAHGADPHARRHQSPDGASGS